MKLGLRQSAASATVFATVVIGILTVDEQVRQRAGDFVSGGYGPSSWGTRAFDVGDAVVSALRHQSIENAPLLVFAVIGAVLVLFMLRT